MLSDCLKVSPLGTAETAETALTWLMRGFRS
jgi:hypothetical protein